jgi:hypothetical protein
MVSTRLAALSVSEVLLWIVFFGVLLTIFGVVHLVYLVANRCKGETTFMHGVPNESARATPRRINTDSSVGIQCQTTKDFRALPSRQLDMTFSSAHSGVPRKLNVILQRVVDAVHCSHFALHRQQDSM